MPSLPNTPHDWAVWLFQTLLDIEDIGESQFKGRLPDEYDFDLVMAELDTHAPRVGGMNDRAARTIEFNPIAANVYRTFEHLVSTPANQSRVPEIFSVLELNYTSSAEPVPEQIQGYFHTVQFWELISVLADHVVRVPPTLFFIESPARKIELKLAFKTAEIRSLPGIDEFSRDFVRTEHHFEQKRDIVRSALIETFPNKPRITFGEIAEKFTDFFQRVKASYAVFAADFSYQKVRSEVEKQNLEDTLRLNKTLADIQNQLLALPAALILAASGLEAGDRVKNISIVVGIVIFAMLMYVLVSNQKSSVKSIDGEVAIRKKLVEKQPGDVSSRFAGAFTEIGNRVTKQRRTLNGVLFLIAVVVACVLILAYLQSMESPSDDTISSAKTVPIVTDNVSHPAESKGGKRLVSPADKTMHPAKPQDHKTPPTMPFDQ